MEGFQRSDPCLLHVMRLRGNVCEWSWEGWMERSWARRLSTG